LRPAADGAASDPDFPMGPATGTPDYDPAMRRPARTNIAFAIALAVVAACTPPPSSALAIHNDSSETLYVRLEGASGVAPLTYRVDPGASGRALAPGEDQPSTRLVVYSAKCKQLVEEANPQLGSMDVDGTGSMSFNVGMTKLEWVMDVLPTTKKCRSKK
jgi:hypothetical protein